MDWQERIEAGASYRFLCNRCNGELPESNRCPHCGAIEFRIEVDPQLPLEFSENQLGRSQ